MWIKYLNWEGICNLVLLNLKKMNPITFLQLLPYVKRVWDQWTGSFFWGWDKIENTFWDSATFTRNNVLGYCRKMWQSSNIELNNDHVLFLTFLSRKKTRINLTNFLKPKFLPFEIFFHLMPITLGSTFGFKNHRFSSPSNSGYTVLKKDCNLRPKGRQSRFSPRHSSDSTEEYTNYFSFWLETDQKIRENATSTILLEEYGNGQDHLSTMIAELSIVLSSMSLWCKPSHMTVERSSGYIDKID